MVRKQTKPIIENTEISLPMLPLIRLLVLSPTQEPEQNYLPMLHGKATDNIASMIGQPVEENAINNTGLITSGEVKLVLMDFDKIKGKGKDTLGVSTHKLLSVAVAVFTEQNHTGSKGRKLNTTEINIPLKEYASICGYDVMEKPMLTDEEEKAEQKRALTALKNARKKITKDLRLLYSASLSWKEKVKGSQGDFVDIRILEAKGIRKNFIQLSFTQKFSNYLLGLPMTQYPLALLGADERNQNAYTLGLKLTEHFNLDNNHKKGTANLLKVKTLLGYTTLPDPESPSVKKNGWESRIKEPLEKSLDALTACGLIEDWRYSHSKGRELTDEEATSWNSFQQWADTLIYFTLKDAPDHTARLEAREQERKEAQKKRTARSRKNPTTP